MTPEQAALLRRPMSVEAVKFKIQTANLERRSARVTFYMDARLAAERLNHAVGAHDWSDDYKILFEGVPEAHRTFYFPIECKLTVAGLTKTDVGNYQKSAADDKALKSGYSDAFKRAAVKHGVGAFLYATPTVFADIEIGQNGKARGFTKAGETKIKQTYTTWLKSAACVDHFGEPLDHALMDDPELESQAADAHPQPAPEREDFPPAPPAQAPQPATLDEVETVRALVGDLERLIPTHNLVQLWNTKAEARSAKWDSATAQTWVKQLQGEIELAKHGVPS